MSFRCRREELNYSQLYVATKLDISQNAYSKIESGATKISISRFVAICNILEMDPLSTLAPWFEDVNIAKPEAIALVRSC
ncbi:helix-turn-helix domain-containing protein [Mucilaginibacter pedocola]|uniref:HTH cro/C1-type domain-containing protein n=1 Tax=Mucilaginibacter pedocola TaxID=1792845 RepID=A0A1S9PHI7_9SPHI|nr:helix-turn-helix transcriptional regulator [Mucilaginibacter pedocola]OOQ60413.1 hypothetical protein BC343_25715 [Mucilaginibacter pedocola]